MKRFDRRTLLRGTLAGGVVTMGLPLLDCFLDDNGTALAQGAPLPLRFGAWMWGCGMNPERWTPATEGTDFELPIELRALDRELGIGGKLRDQVSILSGFDVKLDGRPNFPHTAGLMGTLTGSLPLEDYTVPAPTLDTIIAAEVAWAARNEMARTIDDCLARRTRALFLNAEAAIAVAPAVAKLLAGELGRDEAWETEQIALFNEIAGGYLVI